jgi:hypothetical protein
VLNLGCLFVSKQCNSYSTSLSSITFFCWSFFGFIKTLGKKILEGPKKERDHVCSNLSNLEV